MKQEIHPGNLASCLHQDVPLYYGSNRGINETEYEMCFKCRRIVEEDE